MTKLASLESRRLIIRPLELSDAPGIYKLVKHRDVSRWANHIPYPYPKNGAQTFIKKSQRLWQKGSTFAFAIVLKEIDEPIGIISLMDVSAEKHHAEIGYWLGKPYWGGGLMTEAVNLVLQFAFGRLKLKIVHAKLFEPNKGSAGVLKKAGFRLDGVLREKRFRYGKWHNEPHYSIKKSEFKKTGPST